MSAKPSGKVFHARKVSMNAWTRFLWIHVVTYLILRVSGDVTSAEEWSKAVRCLGKAPESWLLDFLKVSHEEFVQSAGKSIEIQKKVCAKIKLVKTGSLSVTVEISFVSSFPSTALQFLGLLSASCCKYMPFMIVDQQMVVNDLPVTLVSLLADQNWNVVAETVTSHLFSSTERIYNWAAQIEDGSYIPGSQPIDESENQMAVFLLKVMHHTCVLLKNYLPLDKQLRLSLHHFLSMSRSSLSPFLFTLVVPLRHSLSLAVPLRHSPSLAKRATRFHSHFVFSALLFKRSQPLSLFVSNVKLSLLQGGYCSIGSLLFSAPPLLPPLLPPLPPPPPSPSPSSSSPITIKKYRVWIESEGVRPSANV
uniref:Putative RST1 protein n=1 Tax=Phaseolus vulgaris TaxID=3885 RepID=D2DW65_PHAVU|nr:putative RST1 protein [Phaseolus vulgaris]